VTGPLDGLGIVEIGSIGPGPFCAMGWRTSAPTCSASTARPVAVSSARTPTTGPSCSTGAWSTVRGTNIVDCGAPFYDVYETSDGRWLSVAALEPQLYRALIELLGLDDHPGMIRRVNDALEAMMFAGRLNPSSAPGCCSPRGPRRCGSWSAGRRSARSWSTYPAAT
jgi:hypothetical protein